jgi:hypothetical protein
VDEPTYEVRVEGAPGYTVLLLKTSDPARLHGVLAQIGNLNLNLISVVRKE